MVDIEYIVNELVDERVWILVHELVGKAGYLPITLGHMPKIESCMDISIVLMAPHQPCQDMIRSSRECTKFGGTPLMLRQFCCVGNKG